jgi:hypothetical protein
VPLIAEMRDGKHPAPGQPDTAAPPAPTVQASTGEPESP